MPLSGCIADDFTGGTDLAKNLVKSGSAAPTELAGVPSTLAYRAEGKIASAVKSGNFGSERFFVDAWELLEARI